MFNVLSQACISLIYIFKIHSWYAGQIHSSWSYLSAPLCDPRPSQWSTIVRAFFFPYNLHVGTTKWCPTLFSLTFICILKLKILFSSRPSNHEQSQRSGYSTNIPTVLLHFSLNVQELTQTLTLSSIVAPTLRVFTATGTETSDSFRPIPSPPNTAPKAPSPSFLFKTSFSRGISQSSSINMDPVKLESKRPSSRRRFLVLRYFEEYLV